MNCGLGFIRRTGLSRDFAVWTASSLVLASLGVAVIQRIATPATELHAAEQALGRHDPAGARVRLSRYLTRWPHDERALFLAAQAARRCDACADAERFLTTFEQESGATSESQLEWALLGAQQGDFSVDENHPRLKVAPDHPDMPSILESMAKGYCVMHHWGEAFAALQQLMQRSPGHVPAQVLLGTTLDRLTMEWAEQTLRRATDDAPQSAAAHAALAGFLQRHGQTREAIYQYELALRLRPADSGTLLGLARAFMDAAMLAEAEQSLSELLAADPAHTEGLVARGRLELRRRRPAEAEPFLAGAVRAAPWHRDAHQLCLVSMKDLGRTEAARQCEARLAELAAEDAVGGRLMLRVQDKPKDVGVRWDLCQWYLRNGDSDNGLAELMEVLRQSRRHPAAHAAAADYFERAGQPRRAALHRTLAGNP